MPPISNTEEIVNYIFVSFAFLCTYLAIQKSFEKALQYWELYTNFHTQLVLCVFLPDASILNVNLISRPTPLSSGNHLWTDLADGQFAASTEYREDQR